MMMLIMMMVVSVLMHLETGQRYFTIELLLEDDDSGIKSIGTKSFVRSGCPEKGLDGLFEGACTIVSSA
jgi:hypothetical protein